MQAVPSENLGRRGEFLFEFTQARMGIDGAR
jgi:hypothetical protein